MAGIKVNLVIFMAIMLASIYGTVAQTNHVVGDAVGWTIPAGGASDYATWASRRTFTVGDVLVFNFTTGQHTVAEVAEAAYGPCSTTTLMSISTVNPTRISLNTAGTHYYICTVGTHCQLGQKLSVNVVAGGASAAPAPAPATPAPVSPPTTTVTPPPTASPSPSGSPTATPSPSGSTTSPSPSGPSGSTTPPPSGSITPFPGAGGIVPPPPADSFAPSLSAAVPMTFLAMTLAFFY